MGKIRLPIKKDFIDAEWDYAKVVVSRHAVAKIKAHLTEDENYGY
jgi:hypothetical protein